MLELGKAEVENRIRELLILLKDRERVGVEFIDDNGNLGIKVIGRQPENRYLSSVLEETSSIHPPRLYYVVDQYNDLYDRILAIAAQHDLVKSELKIVSQEKTVNFR